MGAPGTLRIVDRSRVNTAEPGTPRAMSAFPSFTVLADGSLLANYTIGTGKDSDDQTTEFTRSTDGGRTWSAPTIPFSSTIDGRRGSFRSSPITRLDGDRLILVTLWVDRDAYPGQPMFHPVTEGCVPMAILVADSVDGGETWTPLRTVPMPDDVGPPSLTNPLVRLPDGRLLLSVETNKPYLDSSRWFQRVVHAWSSDGGQTWTEPVTVAADPTGRIANWDQRKAVSIDGRLVAYTWVYDFEAVEYRNILRYISTDGGATYGEGVDLGIADQPSHPAMLPDGRVVLAWVDRFGSGTIKARIAASIDDAFDPDTEITIHPEAASPAPVGTPGGTVEAPTSDTETTGDALVEMGEWLYGLAFADVLPDGDVGVVYYAPGPQGSTEIRWARLGVEG